MLHWPLHPAMAATLAVALLACGRTPINEPRTPSNASALPRHAKLHFEARGGKPFPYPLVHVTVAGTPTTMIVDTGASSHVLASSFVKRLGLTTYVGNDPDHVTDHAGQRMAVQRVSKPNIVVEGFGEIPEVIVVAVDLPPIFDDLQIGGILSPQRLARLNEATILDFPAETLEVLPSASAHAKLARQTRLRPVIITTCKKKDPSLREYAIQVQVEDITGTASGTVHLEIDTGASDCDVKADSELGRKLASMATASMEPSYAASGRMETHTVRGAKIHLGDRTETVDLSLVPGKPSPCDDGVLGMDVLRRCVLMVGDSAAAACEP